MFTEINNKLEELQQKIYRSHKIDSLLDSLRDQLIEQKRKQLSLESKLKKENVDVEKLSKMSVASLFYTILGSKEKQLEKERQDVLAAQLKLDDINMQIHETERRISELQTERAEIQDPEQKYSELFREKYKMLMQKDREHAAKIIELENKISAYKANLKEISEAISAGNSVMHGLDRASDSLNSAEGWGMWDMLGGGFVTDVVKHGHIDDARSAVSEVQMQLNRFRSELADVRVSSDISIEIDGFVKFADFFFDGFISDWLVQSKIHKSQASINNVRSEVMAVLNQLSNMQLKNEEILANLEDELNQLIVNAK
jgi:DNA repair exonuclease SbcCD ATPase subunit